MAQYKLTYFNGLGIGEVIRLIFTQAGVAFEDVRVSMEKWPELKPSTPMGGLPLLETDGTTLCQSLAIARFLARRFGLAGKTELEQAKVDMVVDSIDDVLQATKPFLYVDKDETRKAELRKVFIEEKLPSYLNNLEKLLKSNNNGDGYFVGDSLTWADLHILTLIGRLEIMVKLPNPLGNHPKLKALAARVSSQPKIADWIAKRQASPF